MRDFPGCVFIEKSIPWYMYRGLVPGKWIDCCNAGPIYTYIYIYIEGQYYKKDSITYIYNIVLLRDIVEKFSALLAFTGPIKRSFGVIFVIGQTVEHAVEQQGFETSWRSCDVTVMAAHVNTGVIAGASQLTDAMFILTLKASWLISRCHLPFGMTPDLVWGF